ncbi:hypothetical protein D3C84_1076620 [compost metagenome]
MTINGITYTGKNISVDGNRVVVDGVEQAVPVTGPVSVVVNGNPTSVETAAGRVQVTGNVGSVRTMSGHVDSGDINGDVTTMSGDVSCKVHTGDTKTVSGNIR